MLTFAAAIPAIISGGIAERAKFWPQLIATAVIVGFIYPFFEGVAWNQHFGFQAWLKEVTGDEFHDFAGSIVVHAVGGWIALPAVLLLGARSNRYRKDGAISAHPPSSIPFLRFGRLDFDRGLVWLQRDERANTRQDFWPRGRQLFDGHGGRHLGGLDWAKTTLALCTTALWLVWSRCVRALT